ncbi:hypothetical protein BU17DRAFT_62989 [Hysterangium stoloniferum]|nr:hypothetical protein BU17DRAFT_62989 [Hysterangium stoloniferum]
MYSCPANMRTSDAAFIIHQLTYRCQASASNASLFLLENYGQAKDPILKSTGPPLLPCCRKIYEIVCSWLLRPEMDSRKTISSPLLSFSLGAATYMRNRKATFLYHRHHCSRKPVAGATGKGVVRLVLRYRGNDAQKVESEEVAAGKCYIETDILQKLGRSFLNEWVNIAVVQGENSVSSLDMVIGRAKCAMDINGGCRMRNTLHDEENQWSTDKRDDMDILAEREELAGELVVLSRDIGKGESEVEVMRCLAHKGQDRTMPSFIQHGFDEHYCVLGKLTWRHELLAECWATEQSENKQTSRCQIGGGGEEMFSAQGTGRYHAIIHPARFDEHYCVLGKLTWRHELLAECWATEQSENKQTSRGSL